MTFDELCEVLRTGKITISIDLVPQEERRHPLDMTLSFRGDDEDLDVLREPEVLEALRFYQATLALLVAWCDVRLCPSPDEHRHAYRSVFIEGMTLFVCDPCAAARHETQEQAARES